MSACGVDDGHAIEGYPADNTCNARPVPATRHTARYGVRRPARNTYASVIYSQRPVLPTDPTRVTSRDACARDASPLERTARAALETKEARCGDCYQHVQGEGQPAWRDAYNDELAQLMIDSDARDALIRQAYRDIANQSSQIPSKPLLCKALARLYKHDPTHRFRAQPQWDDEDWQVARWYNKHCYPYVTAAGSTMWYEPPLVRREWLDNLFRQLGPAINYMGCSGLSTRGRPCENERGERGVYARKPTQHELQQWQQRFGAEYARTERADQVAQLRAHYGLYDDGARGAALQREQGAIVRDQRALRDAVNPDYGERVYQAQVNEHVRQQRANQARVDALNNCQRCGMI